MALTILTLVSLLVAVIMAFVAWRVTRESRERSAARVAALSRAIDGTTDDEYVAGYSSLDQFAPVPTGTVPAHDSALGAGMFNEIQATRSPLLRIGPALLAGALLVGSGIALAVFASSGSNTASAEASESRPLELLSLRHEMKPGALTVTGLVRNPSSNPAQDHITALVFLFDSAGGFVGSGRAPLDFSSLAPGEESPFVVTVNTSGAVARYRVSFRRDGGGVIQHVDRREGRQP